MNCNQRLKRDIWKEKLDDTLKGVGGWITVKDWLKIIPPPKSDTKEPVEVSCGCKTCWKS